MQISEAKENVGLQRIIKSNNKTSDGKAEKHILDQSGHG